MAITDEAFAALEDKVERQGQHAVAVQQYILGRLENVNGILVQHTSALAEQAQMLRQQAAILADQNEMLVDHSVRLERIEVVQGDHSVRLERIEAAQVDHTRALADHRGRLISIEHKLDALPRVLEEILKADREAP